MQVERDEPLMTHALHPSELRGAVPVGPLAWVLGDVELRPLRPDETADFSAHLKRLDERGRRLRFGSPVNDAFIETYVREQTEAGAHIIGAFCAGVLRGVAELCFDPGDPSHAEAAFSLEKGHRGAGLGTRLFERILAEAGLRGIRRLTLQCLRENAAMLRIARRFAGSLEFDGSEVVAEIRVPPAALPLSKPLSSPVRP